MDLTKPILIVSTLKNYGRQLEFGELERLKLILDRGATGLFIADYREFDLEEFRKDKLILTDCIDKESPQKNLRNVLYETDKTLFGKLILCFNESANLIPSISYPEQAEIVNRYKKESNYDFVDIGPVGLCSRENECGTPIKLEGVKDILDVLNPDIPYVLSGGIRTAKRKRDRMYSIEELCTNVQRPPVGFIVGSDISNQEISEIPNIVEEYISEMRKFI